MITALATTIVNRAAERIARSVQQPNSALSMMRFPSRRIYRAIMGREVNVELADAFRAWSGICINRRARAVAGLQWKVKFDKSQEEAVDLPNDNWCVELFNNPNPHYTRFTFFDVAEKWWCSRGNTFIWTPVLDGDKHPRQMWVLPSDMVEIVLSREEGKLIEGYYFTIYGQKAWIDAEEMIHIANIIPSRDPVRMIVGVPLVNLAAQSIVADAEFTEYVKRYLHNDGLPPVVGMTEENYDPKKWELVKASIQEKMPKLKIIGLLQQGLKLAPALQQGAGTSTSTQNVALLDPINKENISAAFGMRVAQITGQNTSYENADANDYSFRLDTIEPQAEYYGQEFTKHFKKFDETLFIEHVPFVRKDPRLEIEKKKTFGFVPNEERKAAGLKPVPGGDVFLIPAGFTTLDAILAQAQISKPTEPKPEPETPAVENEPAEPEAKKSFKSDDAEKEKKLFKLWKSRDDLREKHEVLLKRGFIFALDDLLKEITGKLDKSFKKKKPADGEAHDLKVADLFDLEEWVKVFEDAVTDDELALITDAARQAAKEVGEDWDEISSDFEKDTAAALTKSTSKIARDPLTTIADEIDDLLKANPTASKGKLVELISARFSDVYSASRINTIATTTATFAINNTQMRVWGGLGFKRRILSQRDGKVRDAHRKADGQKENENGKFLVGGEEIEHPGAGSDPKNNINCRCYTMVDGEE